MTKPPREHTPVDAARLQRYILVVAGHSDDLYRTSMLLQRLAYPVCTAQSGKQAVDMVLVSRPALVITELVLPDMGGLDLLRRLGCDARMLPVILLLPTSDSHVEKRDVEIGGAIPCLSKPVQADELYRLVQAAIEPTPRTTIRVAMRLPVIVNRVPLDSMKGEYITDLSEEGMYVRTLRPPSRGEKVTVQMQIDGRDISADASVIYVHRPTEGLFREPGMALHFDRLSPEDRQFIRQYVRDRVTTGILKTGERTDP